MRLSLLGSLILMIASSALLTPSLATAETTLTISQFESELRFGPEMTISSQEILDSFPRTLHGATSPVSIAKIEAMRRNIQRRYTLLGLRPPRFEFFDQAGGWPRHAYRIRYPDRFELTMITDPGVIELNSTPSSQIEIERHLGRFQSDFFDEGARLGLTPALFTGSGHIHIEVTRLHPVTVRNFLASFFNSTGLAAGALNEDVFNAIGMGEIPEENKSRLRAAFLDFDRIERPRIYHLNSLAHGAYAIPLAAEPPEYREARNEVRPRKYFAVNFGAIDKFGTIEIRSIRPQASALAYLKLVKLFVARMKVAERQRRAGVRVPIGELRSLRGNPQAILAEFDRYVTEAGLRFEDYREFILPWWQNPGGEADRYMANRRLTCQSLFR